MSPPRHRRRRRLAVAAATTALLLGAGLVAANTAFSAEAPGDASIRINQLGYAPGLKKLATVVNSSTTPLGWQLRSSAGTTVATGTSTVRGGTDTASGDRTHTVDFSSYQGTGTGFRLVVNGLASHAFTIADGLYKPLVLDAMSFFYQQRSGIAIDASLVQSPAYARPAGHLGVAPNLGDTDVPCVAGLCGYRRDVRGGWYDAGDQGKYVINGGITTWQLMNAYERSQYTTGANRSAFADGSLRIPERANGVPDILDEARWELEFLLRMQVPDGQQYAGMAFGKMHDAQWTGIPMRPDQDPQQRELHAPTTAATLNLAATAAQCARIWKTIDPTFAGTCQTAATKARAAAQANPSMLASASDGNGGGTYVDNTVTDEFYWAAAELAITTGSSTYTNYLASSPHSGGRSLSGGFSWNTTAPAGDISLAVVPNGYSGTATIRQAIVTTADTLVSTVVNQAYPAPLTSSQYWWGSNSEVGNRGEIMALAADLTGDVKYRDGALAALDYLLGRNAMGNSYVTGYGTVYSKNQHHRFWANQANSSYPNPPNGSLAGGPNPGLEDPYGAAQLAGCSPAKCYIDNYQSYSTNEVAINWNSSLAWLAAYAAEKTATTVNPSQSASASPSASGSAPASPSASGSSPSSSGSCAVAYSLTSQWTGGFQADVKITNTGTATVNGWTLTWTFANGQTITQLWGGTVAQSGSAVTVTNAGYTGTIAPNAAVSFGFIGGWTGTNAKPASFQLNGTACTAG